MAASTEAIRWPRPMTPIRRVVMGRSFDRDRSPYFLLALLEKGRLRALHRSGTVRRTTSGGTTMAYAAGRVINDADSHIMESLDWLSSHADPAIRERLGSMRLEAGG